MDDLLSFLKELGLPAAAVLAILGVFLALKAYREWKEIEKLELESRKLKRELIREKLRARSQDVSSHGMITDVGLSAVLALAVAWVGAFVELSWTFLRDNWARVGWVAFIVALVFIELLAAAGAMGWLPAAWYGPRLPIPSKFFIEVTYDRYFTASDGDPRLAVDGRTFIVGIEPFYMATMAAAALVVLGAYFSWRRGRRWE